MKTNCQATPPGVDVFSAFRAKKEGVHLATYAQHRYTCLNHETRRRLAS